MSTEQRNRLLKAILKLFYFNNIPMDNTTCQIIFYMSKYTIYLYTKAVLVGHYGKLLKTNIIQNK